MLNSIALFLPFIVEVPNLANKARGKRCPGEKDRKKNASGIKLRGKKANITS